MLKVFKNKVYNSKYSTYAVMYDDKEKMFCVGEWSPSCCGYLRTSQLYKNPVAVENIIKKWVNKYD